MDGQQAESAYARVDYVDGKFREHDKKHTADMNGIKVSFEQAAEKYNKLKEQVIGLKAVVESLQNIIGGTISSKNSAKFEGNVDVVWINKDKLCDVIRKKHPDKMRVIPEIYAAFHRRGDIKQYFKKDGGVSYYKVTEQGESSGLVTRPRTNNGVLFNSGRIDEIIDIVDEYHAVFEKTMAQVMGGATNDL